MRILVISDIHANLVAFEKVLETTKDQWDQIWFLGDLVGYGPSPNECVQLMQQLPHKSLSGNHDWATLGRLDIEDFNREAKAAIEWTQNMIDDNSRAYLEPLQSVEDVEPFTIAHGSPRHPVWEYILDESTASINFLYFHTSYCLVGHTHVPLIFEEKPGNHIAAYAPPYDTVVPLGRTRLILNPGSVGQPRDSDPRAAYALLDTEKMQVTFHRVEYDIKKTQTEMEKFGLPERLVARLSYGW